LAGFRTRLESRQHQPQHQKGTHACEKYQCHAQRHDAERGAWHKREGDSVKKGHAVRLWLSAGASTVPVPDLQGQDSADALTHIQEASFQVEGIDYSPSNRIPSGHVLHTDSTSGTLLTRGSSIRLTISSGADPDSVSDSVPTAPTKPAPRTF